MNKWISVEDRLPELHSGVLIVVSSGAYTWVQHGEYDDDGAGNRAWYVYDEELNAIELWDDHIITHWRPLPPLPKSQGGSDE